PALHPVATALTLPQVTYNAEIFAEAMRFQENAIRDHVKLRSVEVVPMVVDPHAVAHPRLLRDEAGINDFFYHEVCPRVKAVLAATDPGAVLRAIPDESTNHADFFLNVSVAARDNTRRQSTVVVEFKLPYGADNLPCPPS
ncbi:hypothetical protein GQ54DRAFT_250424, partial [Martensiomyces pterosporus]